MVDETGDKMSSIVLDLQKEITKPDCDIVNVLRKAHVIAVKLGLSEFDQWISHELNGYHGKDIIPEYREVRGVLKALNPYHGWIPTMLNDDELESKICTIRVPNSISEIVSLSAMSDTGLMSEFTGEKLNDLNHIFATPMPLKYALHFSGPAIVDIIEKVKNAVLEWTLKLEAEGILGEGMRFNTEEKERAQSIPQTINNFYGNANVINSPVDRSAIIAGDGNTVHFTYEAAKSAISEIESSVEQENLSADDKEAIMEMLGEIKGKISQEKKPGLIKAALSGFKDYLIGVGASATVAVVQTKLHGLF